MITHVVMLKFKTENKSANIASAVEQLRAMVGRVPSLRSLDTGVHCLPSGARAQDLALITRFDDVAGLSAYAEHPVHVAVKTFLAGVVEASYVVDFESSPA
jgi:antibiotic biosynthesis monooxygenase (ABM) superfamily enzyme